jgi:hypothetical protein
VKSNPPIKGHRLLYEGRISYRGVRPAGGCECGAKPDDWPKVSAYSVKQWHREHKAEQRGEVEVPADFPADAPEVGSIWQAERSGRAIEVRALTETNGVWQVETESHPVRAIRTAYTLPDFYAMFTPAQTGDH